MTSERRDELRAHMSRFSDISSIGFGGLTAGELRELLSAHEAVDGLRESIAVVANAREQWDAAGRRRTAAQQIADEYRSGRRRGLIPLEDANELHAARAAAEEREYAYRDAVREFVRQAGELLAAHEARTVAGTAAKEGA